MKDRAFRIEAFLKNNGGYAHLYEFIKHKIDPRDIKKLVESKRIEKIKQGLYRLSDIKHPDKLNMSFIDISKAINNGIICLISALEYYDLTTQNPGENYVAVPHNKRVPKIIYPPVNIFYFRKRFYDPGIIEISTQYGDVKMYNQEKTICDMFRYRKKLGEDIAIEALKIYLNRKGADLLKLKKYAEICQVKALIESYVKVLVG